MIACCMNFPFHVMAIRFWSMLVLLGILSVGTCADEVAEDGNFEQKRMELMRRRALAITFTSDADGLPKKMESEPLFRYDDLTRGYVDGAVWRWGAQGRPLAIITTELNPRYLGSSPRVVYDFLSFADFAFAADSDDASWRPSRSAVQIQELQDGPKPALSRSKRLFQMKQIAQRFQADQIVSEEPPEKKLSLRLLPRPIDRYVPSSHEHADGATFLFVAGRMPGIILLLETDGAKWQFGVGRLSAPSTLSVTVDGQQVYRVPPNFGTWSSSYNASNSPAKIPGY